MPEEEAEELTLIYEARVSTKRARRGYRTKLSPMGKRARHLGARRTGNRPEIIGRVAFSGGLGVVFLLHNRRNRAGGPVCGLSGITAVALSVIASSAMLFAVDAAITVFTGQPVLRIVIRQIVFGLAAATVTFGIGNLFRVSFGIWFSRS